MPKGPCFRMIINGKSGSGKTELVMNMLKNGWIAFDQVFILAKNPDQKAFEKFIEEVEKLREKNKIEEELVFMFTDPKELPKIEDLDKIKKTVLLIDDFICDKKSLPIIENYWMRSRYKRVSCIFLGQKFHAIPDMIRSNTDYFCIFPGLKPRALSTLYKDFDSDFTIDQFRKLYRTATAEAHQFFFIDTMTDKAPLKFRKGFDGLCVL
jgi:hypothetical protein